MSNATYNVVEPIASDWLEIRDPAQDLLPINPCCLFTHEDAYNKSIPSRTPSLQCKCAYCGKIFLINKHTAQDIIVKKRRSIYCSCTCSNKSKVKRHQPYQCEMCGKTVQADEYYGEGRFCSPSCSRKYSSKFANSEESIKKKTETLRKHYGNKLKPDRKKQIKHKKIKSLQKKKRSLISKRSSFSIATSIRSFNQKHLHIPVPAEIEEYIHEGAAFILAEMTKKWSLFDIQTLLNIKDGKTFKEYCKSLLIEDNPGFIKNTKPRVIKICRRMFNKPLSAGSITIEERNKIGRECERLLYEEKWSTKRVCKEYLHCENAFNGCLLLSALGVRTYTVSEALLIRHNISPEQRNAFKNYRRKCKFNFTRELEECLFGADKKTITNDTPAKDHMISVIYGFIHNIDPYLMSHPANCMILSNSSNSSKRGLCSITLEELMEQVEWFNNTILSKTEDYAKKYRKTAGHRLGNMFPIESIHRFKMLSMIE